MALVRGINVGGRNKVAMADLRAAFEAEGYADVATYIQSGNVVFGSGAPRAQLEGVIESMLEARFGVPLVVVVRSHPQLSAVVGKAPSGFGQDLGHDVQAARPDRRARLGSQSPERRGRLRRRGGPGQHAFSTPGTSYRCLVPPGMEGTVKVSCVAGPGAAAGAARWRR